MIRIEIKVVIDGDLRRLTSCGSCTHFIASAVKTGSFAPRSAVLHAAVVLTEDCSSTSLYQHLWCWQRRVQTPDYKTDQKKGAKSIPKCWKAASRASNNKHRKIKASPSAKTQPVGETERGASPLKLYLGQNPPLQNKPSSTVNTNHSQQLREEPS